MSSSRVSLAPGAHQRRATSLLPRGEAGGFSGGASGSSGGRAASFRPHVLLTSSRGAAVAGESHGETSTVGAAMAATGTGDPTLDYRALTDRIEAFKELFVAHLENATQTMQTEQTNHSHALHDGKRATDVIKEHIERQKDEQKALYQTVASERQAEGAAQAQLSQLQASRASLAQRLADAEAERDKLLTGLERKMRSHEARRQQLTTQVKRNRPELIRFNEKLGCRVSAGSDNVGRNNSVIKFTFNLLDPKDWTKEGHFTIDASKTSYRIVDHAPTIPEEQLTVLVEDLNKTRALFIFIKKMRALLKEQMLKEPRRR